MVAEVAEVAEVAVAVRVVVVRAEALAAGA